MHIHTYPMAHSPVVVEVERDAENNNANNGDSEQDDPGGPVQVAALVLQ